MWLHCICCFPQEVQVKALKVGTLVASDLGSLLPHVSAGEDGCESDAAGRTEEPDLGGGSEMLAAELQLAACLSMGFDGGRASSL